jgi:hypothetical protein
MRGVGGPDDFAPSPLARAGSRAATANGKSSGGVVTVSGAREGEIGREPLPLFTDKPGATRATGPRPTVVGRRGSEARGRARDCEEGSDRRAPLALAVHVTMSRDG